MLVLGHFSVVLPAVVLVFATSDASFFFFDRADELAALFSFLFEPIADVVSFRFDFKLFIILSHFFFRSFHSHLSLGLISLI